MSQNIYLLRLVYGTGLPPSGSQAMFQSQENIPPGGSKRPKSAGHNAGQSSGSGTMSGHVGVTMNSKNKGGGSGVSHSVSQSQSHSKGGSGFMTPGQGGVSGSHSGNNYDRNSTATGHGHTHTHGTDGVVSGSNYNNGNLGPRSSHPPWRSGMW